MKPDQEPEEVKMEVLSPLDKMSGAELKSQVEIAHQFPRSMKRFLSAAEAMATIDEETAMSCLYRRPVGGDGEGGQKMAEGMSVRMAEIVGAAYGNLRVQTQTVFQDERKVTVRGTAHDLESNFASSAEVSESTVKKNGQVYSERQRLLVEKVAHAKARRDAIFQVVPRALAKPIEASVKKILIGDAKTLEKRRGAVKEWIEKMGIDANRIFSVLKISGYPDLGPDQLEILTGIRTAIRDGDETFDSAFPPVPGQSGQKEPTSQPRQAQNPPNSASGGTFPASEAGKGSGGTQKSSQVKPEPKSQAPDEPSEVEKLTQALDVSGVSIETVTKVLIGLGFLEKTDAPESFGILVSSLTPKIISELSARFSDLVKLMHESEESEAGLAPAAAETVVMHKPQQPGPSTVGVPENPPETELDLLRLKLEQSGILEAQLLRWAEENKKILPGIENLAAVFEVNPALVRSFVLNFGKIQKAIADKNK